MLPANFRSTGSLPKSLPAPGLGENILSGLVASEGLGDPGKKSRIFWKMVFGASLGFQLA